ncbi:MAG: MoaD/ThiS family protein [Methanofastidiosum sp.]
MKILVKYFASFKELTGKTQESIQIEKGKTTKDLLEIIMKKYNFKDNVNIVIALNQEYIKTDILLKDGDEVAIMMPSSGG